MDLKEWLLVTVIVMVAVLMVAVGYLDYTLISVQNALSHAFG